MIASYFIVTGVLTSKECQEIIDYCTDKCRSSDVTAPVSNESSIVKDVRNSLNTFISPDELPIIRKAIDCAVKVSSENFNFPLTTIEPIQYAEYTEGMYYNAHTDSGETLEHDRDISTSLFLSSRNEYEGGNLCIRYPNNWVEIDEQQGSMVVFSSMLVHKVKPVEKGKRSSLVMWCKR